MITDLVLIHGFWSSPATWDNLAARIADDPDLPNLRIHRFGYRSPKMRLPLLPSRIPDYNDIAQTIPAYLDSQIPHHRARLAIVTHSQGGLILQRFLAWMLQEGRGRDLGWIGLIVMLACPNEGSEYLHSIRAVIGFAHHPQAKDLRVLDTDVGEARRIILRQIINAPVLDERNCQIPFYVYSGDSDNVVRRESAQSVFPCTGVLPGDHFSILNPDSPGNLTLPVLKRHLLGKTSELPALSSGSTADTESNPPQEKGDIQIGTIAALTKVPQGEVDPDAASHDELSVSKALRELRELLANFISAEEEAKRIALDSGLSLTAAWWSRDPRSFWQNALNELDRAWRMERLFASADDVFGDNPHWHNAKERYRKAGAASVRRRQRYLTVGFDAPSALTADAYHSDLRALKQALDRVVPVAFRDPRISTEAMSAASAALRSVRPLVDALTAAAKKEMQPSERPELQRLDGTLRRQYAEVSDRLTTLAGVAREADAEPLCRDLAAEGVALIATGARAISRVT